jgi:2-polyprenyl-3-methyl-5-hydroxy-6-metoxy-1,4-benzoquinol methylase
MKERNQEQYFIDDVFYGKKSPAMAEFSKARVDVALDMIKSERGKTGNVLRVLDVGCGDGRCSEMILDMGNEVYGIDIRPDRVESAKQKGIKASVADLTKSFPFDDEFFDLIYAVEILEHIYDTEFFLQEAKRLLRKNGTLIVTVPNIVCLPNRIRAIFGLYPKHVAPARKHWSVGEHIRVFTKSMLINILERNGFEIEDVEANLVSFAPTKRTKKPWSKYLGKIFPGLGEVLICKARRNGL